MKFIAITLVVLWSTAALAVEGYINGNSWFGCTKKEYFRKLVRYAARGDEDAFAKGLALGLRAGMCTLFKNGEKVYITDTSLLKGEVKVRRPGQMVEYWTVMEAVKSR